MIMKNDRFIGSPVSKQLGPRPVLRSARIRFPQNHVRNPRPRRQILQLPRDLIVEILRHVFRRRIHGLEGFQIVHELVVEPAHDLADHLLKPCEVHQKPDRIELRPFERHAHAIIVAVHVLALAPVSAQGMPCRKGLFYANLKHVSPKLRYTLAADPTLQEGLAECAPSRSEPPFASRNRATSASSCVIPYRGSDSKKILP